LIVDPQERRSFQDRWARRFPGAGLPLAWFYADEPHGADPAPPAKGWSCLIGRLAAVRQGRSIAFDADAIGCAGGKRYLGFPHTLRPHFEHFLSCGLPGEVEGERYIKTPEMVKRWLEAVPLLQRRERYIVFKRWDRLEEGDAPEVVVFFGHGDLLSGLFTLAAFGAERGEGVRCPFTAGCGAVVGLPALEGRSSDPKAILGMFDPSARPCVGEDELSFAVPWAKFLAMASDMDESFLVTDTWKAVERRLARRSGRPGTQ
jgi:uncharacterized protein (DUF169 family)